MQSSCLAGVELFPLEELVFIDRLVEFEAAALAARLVLFAQTVRAQSARDLLGRFVSESDVSASANERT